MFEADALTFGKVVERLIWRKGATKTSVARELGFTDAAVHRLINDISSPTLNRAISVLSIFGYELAVVPKGASLPDDSVLLLHAETDAERAKRKKGSDAEEEE